jgi:hypothetical protein
MQEFSFTQCFLFLFRGFLKYYQYGELAGLDQGSHRKSVAHTSIEALLFSPSKAFLILQ